MNKMQRPYVGLYKYQPRFSSWAVYRCTSVSPEVWDKVSSHGTKEEAKIKTYELNGWKLKK